MIGGVPVEEIWKREKDAKNAVKEARRRHLMRAFAGIDRSAR